jgi:hypothetical protein
LVKWASVWSLRLVPPKVASDEVNVTGTLRNAVVAET